MGNRGSIKDWANILGGAGLALFILYVMSQAITILTEGWPRLIVGSIGIGLMVGGKLLGSATKSADSTAG